MAGKGFPWMGRRIGRGAVLLLLGFFATMQEGQPADAGSSVRQADLQPVFKKWGLGPRCQGNRDTCSVFVLTGALEYARASREDRGTTLSVEFLNWASNQAVGQARDGGFFAELWKGFSSYGICPEPDMPYQNAFDSNRAPSPEAKEHARPMLETGYRLHWIKRWDPRTGVNEKELGRIKQTLDRQWPVCGGFRWPLNPVQGKDDVLEMPPPEGVADGHSVLLVGYRDDPEQPGGGTFLFRNTNNDGREGRMTYAYAGAYMNDAAWVDFTTDEEK
jgi:hypothetical protein